MDSALQRCVPSRSRVGSSALVFAVMLFVILGFAALSIDIGYHAMVKAQLQSTTDAAAHAAAHYLDGTEAGQTDARSMGVHVAQKNQVNGSPVRLDDNTSNDADGDLVIGVWEDGVGFVASDDPSVANTVLVNGSLQIDTLFARVAYGRDELGVRTRSVAQKPATVGAGKVSCYLPLALPDCMLDTNTESELQDMTLILNPAGGDNVGWGRGDASPNATWISSHVTNCESDGQVGVGDQVGLGNGVINSSLGSVASAVANSSTTWDSGRWGTLPAQQSRSGLTASQYGHTLEGPIILFDGGAEYCSGGGAYNGYETITGFVWGGIYDVIHTGPAGQRNIFVRLDLSEDRVIGEGSGGIDAGIQYQPPVLILQ